MSRSSLKVFQILVQVFEFISPELKACAIEIIDRMDIKAQATNSKWDDVFVAALRFLIQNLVNSEKK